MEPKNSPEAQSSKASVRPRIYDSEDLDLKQPYYYLECADGTMFRGNVLNEMLCHWHAEYSRGYRDLKFDYNKLKAVTVGRHG